MTEDYELTLNVTVMYDRQEASRPSEFDPGESHIQNLSVWMKDESRGKLHEITAYLSQKQIDEIYENIEDDVPANWAELEKADADIDRMKEES